MQPNWIRPTVIWLSLPLPTPSLYAPANEGAARQVPLRACWLLFRLINWQPSGKKRTWQLPKSKPHSLPRLHLLLPYSYCCCPENATRKAVNTEEAAAAAAALGSLCQSRKSSVLGEYVYVCVACSMLHVAILSFFRQCPKKKTTETNCSWACSRLPGYTIYYLGNMRQRQRWGSGGVGCIKGVNYNAQALWKASEAAL